MAVRYTSSILIAAGITFLLFLLMQSLVLTERRAGPVIERHIWVDVFPMERQLAPEPRPTEVPKPDPVVAPPPDIDVPRTGGDRVSDGFDFTGPDPGKTVGVVDPGRGARTDGEYLPMVLISPDYPRRAAMRGVEGYAVVELTVLPDGTTTDVVVVEADPPGYFEKAARDAAERFRYRPRVVGGEPIAVAGVRYRFTFELD